MTNSLQDMRNTLGIDTQKGAVLIEFGASWCSYCQSAEPNIRAALAAFKHVIHIKIEDGKGQRLGRSFGVKEWPTLIFLQNGVEINRLIRPQGIAPITEALKEAQIKTLS